MKLNQRMLGIQSSTHAGEDESACDEEWRGMIAKSVDYKGGTY